MNLLTTNNYLKLIAFDIDGVIADSHIIFDDVLKNKYGFSLKGVEDYHFSIPGISWEEINETFRDMIRTRSCEININDKTKTYLTKLYNKHGLPVIFITARSDSIRSETEEWFRSKLGNDIEYRIYHCSDFEKSTLVKSLDIQSFVEDHVDNANSISKITKIVYLINQSWNLNYIENFNVIRINNIQQIGDI